MNNIVNQIYKLWVYNKRESNSKDPNIQLPETSFFTNGDELPPKGSYITSAIQTRWCKKTIDPDYSNSELNKAVYDGLCAIKGMLYWTSDIPLILSDYMKIKKSLIFTKYEKTIGTEIISKFKEGETKRTKVEIKYPTKGNPLVIIDDQWYINRVSFIPRKWLNELETAIYSVYNFNKETLHGCADKDCDEFY